MTGRGKERSFFGRPGERRSVEGKALRNGRMYVEYGKKYHSGGIGGTIKEWEDDGKNPILRQEVGMMTPYCV